MGLVRLAEARSSFYGSFVRQLMNDPLFFRDETTPHAKQRKWLFPDFNGNALRKTLPSLIERKGGSVP